MTDGDWELFDSLCRQLHAQGARIAELETRVESLLRQSASPEREATHTVLKLAEPPPETAAGRAS